MSETRQSDATWPVACAWWCALAAASFLLSGLAPAGVLHDPRVTPVAGLTLFCTELTSLAALVAAAVGVSGILARFRRPVAPSLRRAGRALRVAAAGVALLAFVGSWGAFWYTGHFLDREAVAFALGDVRTVLGYAAGMNGPLFLGLVVVTASAGYAASELLPRWLARRRPAALLRFTGITLGSAIGCAAAALGGALLHGESLAERRDFGSGPSTRILADLVERPEGPPGEAAPAARRPIGPEDLATEGMNRWNVVVVLIDSLRADQLRACGGTRDVLPALDAAARDGLVFTDCLSTATHTDFAAPSALSSHYPLRAPVSAPCPPNPSYPRVLLYDVLKRAGYRTAIFSSQDEHWRQMNHYFDTGSLDRYFHAASDPSLRADRARTEYPEGTIDDAVTAGEAMKWLDEAPGSPFFLCLNLQNAHAPYHVPKDFARPFGPARRDFPISFGWFPPEKTGIVKDLYADSLAYVDLQLAGLFRHLRERGLWERTIVVVTADHGEAFFEHGDVAHGGPLHVEQTRVPLVLRGPGIPRGSDPRPAQILDVPPTVCHALGLRAHPSFQGVDLLAPSPAADRSRFLVVQTPFARQYAVVRTGRKLIYDARARRSSLYDLDRDPGETEDRSASEPEVRHDLESRLAGWYRAQVDYYRDRSRHAAEYPPLSE